MDNKYDQFDKHIRAKLEHLEAKGTPEGWDLLAQKIDADPDLNPSAESVGPFDKAIRSKLESSQEAYDPAFWSLMEKKIEADVDLSITALEDVAFDGLIYENLHRYQVPYNASHWELMARRIREEFSLQNKLYRYKVVELSLMILAIFTLFQFYTVKNITQKHTIHTPQATISTPAPTNKQVYSQTPEKASEGNASEALQAQLPVATPEPVATQPFAETANPSITASGKVTSAAEKEADMPNPYLLPELTISHQTGTSFSASSLPLSRIGEHEAAQEQKPNAVPAESSGTPGSAIATSLALETAPAEALDYTGENALPYCVWCIQKQKLTFKLGMMTSMDLNYVMTPYDEKFEEASYSQLTPGYTGGLSFGMYRGRWGLNTGLIYSSKHYEPKSNVELSGSLLEGYTGEGFKAAQLNILSLPMNFQYTFDSSGKWQWYAIGGLSAKFATNNNFDVKTFPVGARSALSAPGSRPNEEEADQEQEETYYGIFEGGNLGNNLFLTGNIGFGMERYVSPRWSVILQPTYQHYLYSKGLGPKNDRFHSLSLYLGVRAKLNSSIK